LPDYVAHAISDYLTSETGIIIIFASAIVPKWKDSRISFKNVYVSRHPPSSTVQPRRRIDHTAAVGYDVSNHPSNYYPIGEEEDEDEDLPPTEEDWNMSLFDLNIDSVDVTLSLWRWLDGKGLVEDAVVKGVRGVLGAYPSLLMICIALNSFQIVAQYFWILKTPPILPASATNLTRGTLNSSLCS